MACKDGLVLLLSFACCGCAGRFMHLRPEAFQPRPEITVVPFDSYDWNAGLLSAPDPDSVREALEPGYRELVEDLAATGFASHGDGQTADTGLTVEVHVMRNLAPDGFWATMANLSPAGVNGSVDEPSLVLRAFDSQGRLVWEDQEVLDLPFAFNREKRTHGFQSAIQEAARKVSQRLSARL